MSLYWSLISSCQWDETTKNWSSTTDHTHAARYSNAARQRASLAGRAALRALLALKTGISDWIIEAESRGRPLCRHKDGQTGPTISIAHSGDLVAVAMDDSGSAMGIDVERHKPRACAALAQWAFGPTEAQRVSRGGLREFYRLWTLREAMGKAMGTGISLAADGRDHIHPLDAGWTCHDLTPQNGYSLGIAVLQARSSPATQIIICG